MPFDPLEDGPQRQIAAEANKDTVLQLYQISTTEIFFYVIIKAMGKIAPSFLAQGRIQDLISEAQLTF